MQDHHEHLEKDDSAGELVCANEVCGCDLPPDALAAYCSAYCSGEGANRGDGVCQCGHVGCA